VNVAVRLVLLFFAVGAGVVGVLSVRQPNPAAGADGARYTCPMHPDVAAAAPDRCPICGMPLARRVPGSSRNPPARGGSDAEEAYVVSPLAYSREVRAPAWVESPGVLAAHVYGDELPSPGEDNRGTFVPTAAPGRSIDVRRVAEPPAPWDASTWLVHFRYDAIDAPAGVGTVGWVKIPARPREALLIPDTAVLQSVEGPYVWAAGVEGTLVPKPVAVGKVFSGNAIVTAGLHAGDRIAVAGAFFFDAERRLTPESEGALEPGP
jgi:heavy metal-binding protein